jgi:cobalt/nickel transport system permease protein
MQLKPGRFEYPVLLVLFLIGMVFMFPTPTQAMHISEGILPADWAIIWYVAAFVFVAVGIFFIRSYSKRVQGLMPLLGLAGAAVFIISCLPIPVPIAGTCSHPCGTPLAAILVGPFISTVLASIALLLQALFLAHGGLSTWGANIMSMGVAGSFAGFGIFYLTRKLNCPLFLAAFLGGLLGDWATYATTSFELASALHGTGPLWEMFGVIAVAFAPTQLPLGILEGLLTGGIVSAVYQRRPDLLSRLMPGMFKAPVPALKEAN